MKNETSEGPTGWVYTFNGRFGAVHGFTVKPSEDRLRFWSSAPKYAQTQTRAALAWAGVLTPPAEEASPRRPSTNPSEAGVKEGDFFKFSWGYDQTNADFFQVVGLTKAGVKLRKVATKVQGQGVVPIRGKFTSDKVLMKRLGISRGEPFVTMASYGWCSKWDGKPAFDTLALGYQGH